MPAASPAAPVTSPSLLLRLRDPQDSQAWREFFDIYSSLVYGYARKRGLQDADAADLMQDVLRSVARNVGKLEYDPSKGTFRAWLYTVTRNKVFNFLERRRRQPRGSGDSGEQERLENQPAAPAGPDPWDREYEQSVFRWAAEKVKGEFQPNTWAAFWRTAVDGRGAKEVGGELGMSPGAVYVAKSRVIARLREAVRSLGEESVTP